MHAAATRSSRTDSILQPSYFSSSLYVSAMRDDISSLVLAFHQEWTGLGCPFTLFKQVWCSKGWIWLTLFAFDDRARDAFLNITCRLFIERMARTEAPMVRIMGLFALYTFFYSQPENTTPRLATLSHIRIPSDQYKSLLSLPGALTTPYLKPFQSSAAQLVATLVDDGAFLLIPKVELRAQKPSTLPHVLVGADMEKSITKVGRPSKRDQAIRARKAVDTLEALLTQEVPEFGHGDGEYSRDHDHALAVSDSVSVAAAQQHVQRRLEEMNAVVQ